jgi:hypothetical protein
MADITKQPSPTPAGAGADHQKTGPTVSKPREQNGRYDLDPGTREWWERFWTDALERLKRYLDET